MSNEVSNEAQSQTDHARVVPLRPAARAADTAEPADREPLWRHLVGDVLRRERLAQERTLKDVAEAARISMPYLSELERGRKEGSSEVLAAAARALGLGLADLLARAHRELSRQAAGAGTGAGADVSTEIRAASAVSELRVRRATHRPRQRPDAPRCHLRLVA